MPKTRVLAVESHPELRDWWDSEQNPGKKLEHFTEYARTVCAWQCPRGHQFEAKVYEVVSCDPKRACPVCRAVAKIADEIKREALWERRKATPVASVPELLRAWRDEADPATVSLASGKLRKFECPNGHHPRVSPQTFLASGCAHCQGAKSKPTYLAEVQPELAAQWHPSKNKLGPDQVVQDSKRVIWWLCAMCGHEWEATVRSRRGRAPLLCPQCKTVVDSLAYRNPELAAEWSSNNEVTAWHVYPYSAGAYEWVCSTDSSHVWQAQLSSRSSGAGCPECSTTGVSAVELAHHEAAVEVFGSASSGRLLSAPEFTTRSSWTADIVVEAGGRTVVIEYDGAYWHADKAEVDERKSRDLLAAGYRVVRLRESPLSGLSLVDDDYLEIEVFSAVPRPRAVIDAVAEWARR